MKIERSLEVIKISDLEELYTGSVERLYQYFITGQGAKWQGLYNIKQPLAVVLCQGAAMHFHDGKNGVKDFDVWFFYPFNKTHLPYRTIWNWDYKNLKFGNHPLILGYEGRKVDVIVRSIKHYSAEDPIDTIYNFLKNEKTATAKALSKKAVVMLSPKSILGKVVWYKGKI